MAVPRPLRAGRPFGAWLHAIATNVCLTPWPAAGAAEVPVAETGEDAWNERLLHLQPYPDRQLDASRGPGEP